MPVRQIHVQIAGWNICTCVAWLLSICIHIYILLCNVRIASYSSNHTEGHEIEWRAYVSYYVMTSRHENGPLSLKLLLQETHIMLRTHITVALHSPWANTDIALAVSGTHTGLKTTESIRTSIHTTDNVWLMFGVTSMHWRLRFARKVPQHVNAGRGRYWLHVIVMDIQKAHHILITFYLRMQWIAEVIKVSAFCQPIIPILFFSIPPPLNEMRIEEVFFIFLCTNTTRRLNSISKLPWGNEHSALILLQFSNIVGNENNNC